MAKKEKEQDIFGEVRDRIESFYDDTAEIMPGVLYSQKVTLEQIEKYHAGKFLSGDKDSEGFQKFFFNISQPRCDVFSKAIDLDSKDAKIDADNRLKGWLMSKEVKVWARQNGFGQLTNEIARVWPIYGSTVVKIVEGKPYVVQIRNLLNDQCADKLGDSWVIERHEYSFDEFNKQKWDADKKKQVLQELDEKSKSVIVYECYWWGIDEKGTPQREVYIVTGESLDPRKPVKNNTQVKGIVLFEKKGIDFPYKELHMGRVPGRWLALGIVEKLFGCQERVNEIQNRLSKIEHWASKQNFQTRDILAQKNLLTDAFDGDILQVNSEITKIDVTDRNAPNMRQDLQTWLAQADKLAFSFETSTGEALPSNTPWRSVFLQQQVASSYFEVQRENFGMFLRDIFVDLIIPSFKKDNKKLHKMIVSGGGGEMAMFRKAIAEEMLKQKLSSIIQNINTFEDLDAEVQKIEQQLGTVMSIEVPDSFYEDLEYWMDFTFTKENQDTEATMQSLTTAMQILGANPGVQNNPAMREIFGAALSIGLGVEKAQNIMGLMELNPVQAPQVAGSVAGASGQDNIAAMSKGMAL